MCNAALRQRGPAGIRTMTDLSISKKLLSYKPQNKVRFVTAAALFFRP